MAKQKAARKGELRAASVEIVIEVMKQLANRYPSCKSNTTDREILRRVILGQLNRICRDRYGAEFPDDEAGNGDLAVLLRYYALHPTNPREQIRHTIETRAPWMSKEEKKLTIGDLAILDPRRLWLAPEERVWLSNADRERLRAWNIPPGT
jgi:hypothetical protein